MLARRIRPLALALALLGLAACGEPGAVGPLTAPPAPRAARSGSGGTGGSGGAVGDYDVVRLAGDGSLAGAVSDAGTIVGSVRRDGVDRPAYWRVDAAGAVTGPVEIEIGVPGRSWAIQVNERDQVVIGNGFGAAIGGYVYDIGSGELAGLPDAPGAESTAPWAISESGVVSGMAYFDPASGTRDQAIVWLDPFDPNAEPAILPLPSGYAEICGRTHLDDAGVVEAFALPENGTFPQDCAAVRWTLAADGTIGTPEILATTGLFEGFDMNDAGQVAGTMIGFDAAVLQPDGSVVGLGPLPGDEQAAAFGISDPVSGAPAWVAGASDYGAGGGGDSTAVVWSVGLDGSVTGPVTLPTGKHETSVAAGVDALGRVVGYVVDQRRATRAAALWIPASSGGGGDGGGGGCVPRGPAGNNCK